MKIKISPLTVAMIATATAMGNLKLYIVTYLVMTVHELAHLIAAVSIGLKPEAVKLSPFGVNLTLKNKIICSLSDEIILYGAGPLINAILAVAALYLNNTEFYRINTVLFVMNLLPIVPLDGGMIALRVISYKFGHIRARKVLGIISTVLATLFLTAAVVCAATGRINISLFVIAVFLIGNLVTSKEKYNVDLINAVNDRNKVGNRTNIVIVNERYTLLDALKTISPSYTTIAVVLDEKGEISGFLSEKEIINKTIA